MKVSLASASLFRGKSSNQPSAAAHTMTVGLDGFGNAIPTASLDPAKAAAIVQYRAITLKPNPKRLRAMPNQAIATTDASVFTSWLLRITKPKIATPTERDPADINARLHVAFERLQETFNAREQQLEDKIQAVQQANQKLLQAKRYQRWLIPALLVGGVGVGYLLHVMTSMQNSMLAMSGNIKAMNQHISTMANDTQVMSYNTYSMATNMQAMNQSMNAMNYQVATMSANVNQMNRQVGTLAQAAAPMSEAASTMSPFMKMFKSFMPF